MRILLLSISLGLGLIGAARAAAVPGPARAITPPQSIISATLPGAKAIALSELFEAADAGSVTWSVDGKALIYTSDQSGEMNIWRQSLAGGAPQQLSRSAQNEGFVTATPDGKWILFQADRAGRMSYSLYALPAAGGRPVRLSQASDAIETEPQVSGDGKLVAFSSRVSGQPSANVAIMDWTTRRIRLLTHEAEPGMQWQVAAISPDDRFIIANRYDFSLTVGEVYRIDTATGAASRLTPKGTFASASDLSSNGRYVALTISNARGVNQAALLELSSRRTKFLAADAWQQETAAFSPDAKALLIVSDVDGQEVVSIYSIVSGKITELALPPGTNSGRWSYLVTLPKYSPDGCRILFLHSSGSAPGEYWVYDVASRRASPITHLSQMKTNDLPPTALVHYRSSDGTVISAFLWLPYNLKRNARAAGVLLVHGGPTGQLKDTFERTAAALASRGYLVLAPNYRGSSGYGQAFIQANHLDLGGGDLEDVVAGARFLIATGYVDPKRVGIVGGSYGGYMTLMALGKTPHVWAVGVDEFGIVNWFTMWKHSAPEDRRYQQWLIGDPAVNTDAYLRSSPLTYLSNIHAPLLVLQGMNDPLVPAEESRQVVAYLKQHDRVVDSHFYPGEGHGFSKRADQIDALRRLVSWLDRYVGAASH